MSTAARAPVSIGRYRLLGLLGEGGMGVVHLAEGPSGEQVALKVLRPHVVGDDEGRSRLAREVTSLRRVNSPRVAEVIDADPWGETPYVVTRYVRGPSLHDLVRGSGPLPPADLLVLARGLAEAVEAVHRVDVLHRDIKPSNVLIEDRAPVLIDFGLARLVDDSRLTVTGWLLGTPGYLAPEIVHGEQATAASDMHGWAATIVFAGTGRSPYGDGPALAVMDRVRRGEYDLSGLPASLSSVISAALSPDPRRRPTAMEAQRWLGENSAEQPTVLAPVRPPSPAALRDDHSTTRPLTVGPPLPYERPRASIRERATGLLLKVSLLATLAAGAVAAPVIAATLLGTLLVLSGASSWLYEALDSRRARRGRRGTDRLWAALLTPWYLLVALPGALALAVVAVGAGVLTTTVVADAAAVGWRWPALLAGGLAAGVAAWWGPLSRRPRAVARRFVASVSRPHAQPWRYVMALLCTAAVLAMVWHEAGTSWWPAPPPQAEWADVPGFGSGR